MNDAPGNLSSLRPDADRFKFLISTPSRFVGEYEAQGLLITHAFSGFQSERDSLSLRAGPYSRNFYVIVCRLPTLENNQRPNYRPLGEKLCAGLTFLFGKRFDFHGLLESHGWFNAPDEVGFRPVELSESGPYSHEPRKDIGIELNLKHFDRIRNLIFYCGTPPAYLRVLFAAAKFYHRSLQIFDLEPGLAYLDLITCGEILSNHTDYPDEKLYDPDVLDALNALRSVPDRGEKAYRNLKGNLRQIKRRFTLMINDLLNDNFFASSETTAWDKLSKAIRNPFWKDGQEDITIDRRISAAYDLRSLYVHTGVDFGDAVIPMRSVLNEVQLGQRQYASKKMQDTVLLAPTYLGLERIMRYCLLRFAHLHGNPIDSRLDGKPAPPFAPSSP